MECAKAREVVQSIHCSDHCKSCCSLHALKKRLPITTWLPQYRFVLSFWSLFSLFFYIVVFNARATKLFRLPELQGDIIAGLTVGLTVIPQGLAYAAVAELPPQVWILLTSAVSLSILLHFLLFYSMDFIQPSWVVLYTVSLAHRQTSHLDQLLLCPLWLPRFVFTLTTPVICRRTKWIFSKATSTQF